MSKLNMLEKNSKNANTKRCFDEFFFGKQQKKNGSKQTKNIVRSLYLKPGMHKVFDTLYHHGKTMYRHAHKHHKKYLWGVAGFFGLFKLFTFLIVSAFSYTAIAADLPALIDIEVPATTIDIQDGKSIIQFDLSKVDIGDYNTIKNINLLMNIDTQEQSINIDTLRNNTTTNIGQTESTQMLGLRFLNTEENIRTIDTGNIPGIIEQLIAGNTIAYLFPQEDVTIQSGTIFMEIETQQPENQDNNGKNTSSEATPDNILSQTFGSDSLQSETTGIDLSTGQAEIQQSETGNLPTVDCGQYDKKKDCQESAECQRDKKTKTCNLLGTIFAEESYQLDITDPAQIPTPSEIKIESKKNKQKINGYLQIHKNTQVQIDTPDTIVTLQSPSLVTDENLRGTNNKEGIPNNFVQIETIQIGDPNLHITAMSGSSGFIVDMEIVNISMIPGTVLHIYTSQDGNIWENLNTTCTIDDQNMCEFITPHLTLFAVGTITWNNLEFVNQNFRDQNPTSGQIIDAFFGTGSSTSAYTTHRSGSCRPTTLTIINPSTRGAITVPANTIYVLNSGNYIQTGTVTMSSCSAIVGSGTVTVDKNGNFNLIHATNQSNIIIDNLQLNGSGHSYRLIEYETIDDTTINDVQAYNSAGGSINVSYGKNCLINNSQTVGLSIFETFSTIVNNSQFYNSVGGAGIVFDRTRSGTINNSQTYNNDTDGITLSNNTGLVINNIESYNNGNYGIYLGSTSPNVRINNSRIFNNGLQQVYVPAGSSGRYYGNNIAYPTAGFANFSAGDYDATLGRATGTLSTTDLGFSCDFVTNPRNGSTTDFYATSDCSDTGATSRTYTPIVKYKYGNNMLSGYYVLRQIQPVLRSTSSLILSSIPYHGHRFIGEYDDPSGRDLNVPVTLFTGETPAQGYNVINTGYFTVRSYIYEPNLFSATRYENINGTTTYNAVYDSGLVLMMNFDNVADIGDTSTLVKDLSVKKNHGTINGATWTANGKWNGAYNFDGIDDYIDIMDSTSLKLGTGITFGGRIYDAGGSTTYRNIIVKDSEYMLRTDSADIEAGLTSCFVYTDPCGWECGGQQRVQTTGVLSTGAWHHVMCTRDSSYLKIYVDGVLDNTVSRTGNVTPLNNNVQIGVRGGARWRSGKIDEPRIYNHALTSDEINHLYHSNLSANSDHREYVVNYTGVGGWSYGTHTYGWMGNGGTNGLIDSDSNGTISTGYVVKSMSCTGSLIGWNNDNYITGGFWDLNPGYCDIVIALYGTGTSGQDSTAYTNNRSPWSGECSYQNMIIVYLTGGTDKIPSTLVANTIYVLASGTYIQTNVINLNICTTIIGQTGDIKIYSSGQVANMIYNNKHFTILDNIQIDGTGNGIGGTHAVNTKGINHSAGTYADTINAVIVKNHDQAGIYMTDSHYNKISNSDIYNNAAYGLRYVGNHNSIVENSKIYNTAGGAGGTAIFDYGSNNIFSGLQIFGNKAYGINFTTASYNTVSNTQFYSNTGAGIYFNGTNDHITFNNIQSFNNNYGVQASNDAYDKDDIAINNSQIYNNKGDGVVLYYSRRFTINNTHIYNNSGNGLYFASTNNSTGILNNVAAYNNGDVGFNSDGGNHIYYGKLTMFNNDGGNIFGFSPGTSSTYAYLGRTGGTTDTTPCMSCSRVTNPNTTIYVDFINTTTYPKCQMRGQYLAWTATDNLNYKYGINITGQKLPVYRTGTTLTGATLGYSGSQYVAEINKIGTYTNTTCTCAGHTYRRNNENFLTSGFWNNGTPPDYCDIIAALYGTGTAGTDLTAYTSYRSGRAGTCNVENTDVIYLTGGTGKIDYDMNPNIIYVLESGNYIQTGTISMTTCNAIIGKTGDISLYSTGQLTDGMIKGISIQYNILDSLAINGTGGIYVPSHAGNNYGINFNNSSNNNTINNIQVFNHDLYGIFINNFSNNNAINNIQAFNNYNGIFIYDHSSNNTLNNVQTYNNSNGISLQGLYNTLNNIQTYNNINDGITIAGAASYNALNNIQVYNNTDYGIDVYGVSNNNIFNNVQAYNNGYGIFLRNSSNNTYYGTAALFNNISGNTGGNQQFIQGTGTYYASLGRTTGSLVTGVTMSRDYLTNPINTNSNYFLPRTGVWTGIMGQQTSYLWLQTSGYSYGSGIALQIQPVYCSGTTLTTGGLFDATKYIGSNITKYTGDLLVPTITYTTGLTVTGIANAAQISGYNLYGDVINPYLGMTINTSTGIYLTSGGTTKGIITQIYSPSYFATHFEKDTTLDTVIHCMTGWDNDNFITGAFWNLSPTDSNIICALYGTGPGDTTAYTQLWNGRDTTQCSGIQINVVYTGNLDITSLASNTIYVLTGPTSDGSDTINTAKCSAVISNQTPGTTFSSVGQISSNGIFDVNGINPYTILDNIAINGTGSVGSPHPANIYGIYLHGYAGNTTLNNIQSYNNDQEGIFMMGASNNSLNNIQTYNNGSDGIHIAYSHNNALNNIQSYNNGSIGIYIRWYSHYNALNNIQSYNNGSAGIYLRDGSDTNMISNIQSYNNQYGIRFSNTSSANTLNNIQCYNNSINGIYIDSYSNTYYGTSVLFNNTNGNTGGAIDLIQGTGTYFASLGRTTGSLVTGVTMSRDYLTNPGSSDYLLPWTGTWTGIIGQQTNYLWLQTFGYSYGSGILQQIQPVYYVGTTLATGGSFNGTKFIGSDLIKVTGDLEGLPIITTIGGLTVTGISNDPLITRYSLFGNIANYQYDQIINTSIGIILTTGLSTNRIITQLFNSTALEAMHFEKDTISDTTAPRLIFTGVNPADGATVTDASITGQMQITETGIGLDSFSRNRNGTLFPIYDSGLLLMMNFDNVSALGETTGGIIKDVSQYGNDGTGMNSLTRTGDGKRNGAYNFDGYDDYIELPGSIGSGVSELTIEAWIRPTASQSNVGIMGREGGVYDAWQMIIYPTNTLYFRTNTTAGAVSLQGSLTLTVDEWAHVVMVYDGTTMLIYKNGIQDPNTIAQNGTILRDGGSFAEIGRYVSSAYSFHGKIDEVRIYDRALSSGEIEQRYRSNLNKFDTGSRSFISLQTGLTTQTYHYTGSACDLTNNCASTGRTLNVNLTTSSDCLSGWDNDNFINDYFRSQNPTPGNIICALYGSTDDTGTAYTKNRSGYDVTSCLNSGFTVQPVSGYDDIGYFPYQNLSGNTIYVLESGAHILQYNSIIDNGECSAIVGKPQTTLYTQQNLGYQYSNASFKNTIIDGISFDGYNDGLGGTHGSNNYALLVYGQNATYNNIKIFNYASYGIVSQGQYVTINNSEMNHDGTMGIYLAGAHSTINNVKAYDNQYGIYIQNNFVTINNTQIFNNGQYGILMYGSSGVFNNVQTFNNQYGIYDGGGGDNTFNQIMAYNNGQYGMYLQNSTSDTYYGDNEIFGNTYNIQIGGGGGFLSGNANAGLGRGTGTINQSGLLSRDTITNPLNASGNYALNRSSLLENMRLQFSNFTSWNNLAPITYSYGGRELQQIQPVTYDGNDNLTGYGTYDNTTGEADRDSGQFIGSDIQTISGSLDISGTITYDSNIIITFTSAIDANYRILGDVSAEITGTIAGGSSITTGIVLSSSLGDKTVILQLRTGNDFATHYADNINYAFQIICADRRNNDNFINDSFRNHIPAPTPGNIVCALYGSGGDGSDPTAYTKNRSSYTTGDCAIDNVISVPNYDDIGYFPYTTLAANTIYVLESGSHILQGYNYITSNGDCSAIVGKPQTTIYTQQNVSYQYYNPGFKNTIIDGVSFDGYNDGLGGTHGSSTYGLLVYGQNATYNNIKIFNYYYYGIYSIGTYVTINNSEVNHNGSAGIYLAGGAHTTINNTKTYDNQFGIMIQADYATINNTQIFNNGQYGILIYNHNDSINNVQTFNNQYGIYDNGGNNTFNQILAYNNLYGMMLQNSPSDTYYGDNEIFGNGTNIQLYGSFLSGNANAGLGWSTGTISQTGLLARDTITNPLNASGNYALNRLSLLENMRLQFSNFTSWNNLAPIIYSYGGRELQQIQPVTYDGSNILTGYGTNDSTTGEADRDTGQFIGSDIRFISGSLQTDDLIYSSGITLTFTSSVNAEYKIFGDITTEITGTISAGTSITTGVFASGGFGVKKIFLQLWTGGDRATHYASTVNYSMADCANRWNNDNFINDSFWNHSPAPTPGNIVCALYGNGSSTDTTAYTKNRNNYGPSTSCSIGNVVVVSGYEETSNYFPYTNLDENTIYVLLSGSHITTGAITIQHNCSSIIGQPQATIYYYGVGGSYITDLIFIANGSYKNDIIDGLAIDGINNGLGSTHTRNIYGILSYSKNSTVNNIKTFNGRYGLAEYGDNNTLNNIQAFNNQQNGLVISSAYNILNNISMFNNHEGISIQGSFNTISNTQAYNNYDGMLIQYSNHNSIYNSEVFNNQTIGINIGDSEESVKINNISAYNNGQYGIYVSPTSTGTKYYGNNNIFDNNIYNGGSPNLFLAGTPNDVPGLNRATGTIDYNIMLSWNHLANPLNASGIYLLDRLADFNTLKGQFTSRTGILPISYSFGGREKSQEQPIRYDMSNTLVNYGTGDNTTGEADRDTGQFIGSDIRFISGSLQTDNVVYDSGITLTFTSSIDAEYRIRGNITEEFTGTISAGTSFSTGVFASGSFGEKNIFVQLWTGSDRTTHYGSITNYSMADCATRWDNDNFINDYFRSQSPTTGNIVCALFGNGSSTDTTAYTKNRGQYNPSSCSPTTVEYISGYDEIGNFPYSALSGNTIYVLGSGTHITTDQIDFSGDCSAIVAEAPATLYSATPIGSILYDHNRKDNIIDGLAIDGLNDGLGNPHTSNQYNWKAGIYTDPSAKNITINNTKIFNNRYGIRVHGDYTDISNSDIFDNVSEGIYSNANNGIINNTKVYHNVDGAMIYFGSYNTINNSQFFNNDGQGLSLGPNDSLNNSQIYNNSQGLRLRDNTTLNNVAIYNNNGDGITIASYAINPNKYYGDNYSFGNGQNINLNGLSGIFITGYASEVTGAGRTDGNISQSPITSRNEFTNPINSDTESLLPRTYKPYNELIGYTNLVRTGTLPLTYSFGGWESTQIQPVKYDVNNTLLGYGSSDNTTGRADRDTGTYITSTIHPLSGSLSTPDSMVYNQTNITITFTSAIAAEYRIFGDITEEFTGNLGMNGSITTGVILSGFGVKNIFLQLWTGTDRATHYNVQVNNVMADCASRWNNDNFINDYFRNHNPTSGNIVCALFGDGTTGDTTAYTKNRHNYTQICSPSEVIFISGYNDNGHNYFPYTGLAQDTIYVLLSGAHDMQIDVNSYGAEFQGGCSALIGLPHTTLYVDSQITAMLGDAKTKTIIDGIQIDGMHDISGNPKSENSYGIYVHSNSNTTINNSKAFGNGYGIASDSTQYNTINNIETFSNGSNGIDIESSNNNILNNINTYNNDREGIYLNSSYLNTINNVQSYNNSGGYGIETYESINNIFNNIASFNNYMYGISLESNSIGNKFNNIAVYNNGYDFGAGGGGGGGYCDRNNDGCGGPDSPPRWVSCQIGRTDQECCQNNGYPWCSVDGIYADSDSSGKYYGANYIFSNATDIFGDFSTGLASEVNNLWTDGSTNTGTLSRNYIANPLNGSGIYGLDWTQYSFHDMQDSLTNLGRNGLDLTLPIQYSFGGREQLQIKPVRYDDTNTLTGYGINDNTTGEADRDTGQFLGSDMEVISGSIDTNTGTVVSSGITVTITSAINAHYLLTGKIAEELSGDIFANTPIIIDTYLEDTPGLKNIILQLSTGNIFATHYDKEVMYLYGCTNGRDNDNFITTGFRALSPNDSCIVYATFGGYDDTDTAYSHIWTGYDSTSCLDTPIVVEHITSSGEDMLPDPLITGTIYVLDDSGAYIQNNNTITMPSCSAIIGKNTANLYTYSYTEESIAAGYDNRNIILDNIHVDGTGDGYGGDHGGPNDYGFMFGYTITPCPPGRPWCSPTISNANQNISFNNVDVFNNGYGIASHDLGFGGGSSTINNILINNSNIYNNQYQKISIQGLQDSLLNNLQVYNTDPTIGIDGIYLTDPQRNQINNSKIFNNNGYGIYLYGYSINNGFNSINNSEFFNNYEGIGINYSSNNTINNSKLYNNSYVGADMEMGGYTGIINNTLIYNNGNGNISSGGGIYINNQSNILINDSMIFNNTGEGYGINYGDVNSRATIYGTLRMFDNSGNIVNDTNNQTILGTGTDFPYLSRADGSIDENTGITRHYMTNPEQNSGIYLLPRTDPLSVAGPRQSRIANRRLTDSIGGRTPTQQTGVIYDTGTLDLIYNPESLSTGIYIASTITPISGSIDITGTVVYDTETQAILNSDTDANFIILGDVSAETIGTINAGSPLIAPVHLSRGSGTKYIFVQFRTGENFATHYTDTVDYSPEISCASRWDNDNFINDDFRNNNPSEGNVICALYGSGSDGSDPTAYTKNRSGDLYTGCAIEITGVVPVQNFAASGYITNYLASNTIYVLESGDHITQSGTIYFNGNCSAIIAKPQATLYSETQIFDILDNETYINNIIDGFTIDGGNDGQGSNHGNNYDAGIYIAGLSNNTINNMKIFNNAEAGIYLDSIDHMVINNIDTFNNDQYGIETTGINYNIFNNINTYNNGYGGMVISLGSHNTINNAQFYNNVSEGLETYEFVNNTINNSQFYNNSFAGIVMQNTSTGNKFNNIAIYNNGDDYGGADRYGLYLDNTSTDNKYYGDNYIFGNATDISGDFSTGLASEVTGTNWTDGSIIDTGTLSRNLFTNPLNTTGLYGADRLTPFTGLQDSFTNLTSREAIAPIRYSFGGREKIQEQTVRYDANDFLTGYGTSNNTTGEADRDTTQFVGSDVEFISGSLEMSGSVYSTFPVTINSTVTGEYRIFGDDVVTEVTGIIGANASVLTTITLSGDYGTKNIFLQLWTGKDFATHYAYSVDLEMTAPIIYFTGTTPASGATITGNNFKPQMGISGVEFMDTFTYTFNGITYPYYDSGLRLMMNLDNVVALGETNGGIIKDFSKYGNNGSGYNGVDWTGDGKRGGAYNFDGLDDYIAIPDISNLDITGNLTMSLWFKTSQTGGGYHTLLGKLGPLADPESSTNFPGYFIFMDSSNTVNCQIIKNRSSDLASVSSISSVSDGNWHFITCTYDGSRLKMYLDNVLVNSMAYTLGMSASSSDLIIGADIRGGVPISNRYFSGLIDEPRIYNRALSSGEISQMWRSNFAKYDTDKWLFTDDRQCMVDGTYTYTGYVSNIIGLNDTTGRTNDVSIQSPTPYAPSGYYLGSTGVSNNIETLSGQFTGYFKIEDRQGTSGWYTTIQLPLTLSGVNLTTNHIDWNNIYFMATGLDTILGTSTSQVYITGAMGSYESFSGAKDYIIRDYVEQYSCPAGIYGNKPYISVDIPAYQNPDTYSGLITIDFNTP